MKLRELAQQLDQRAFAERGKRLSEIGLRTTYDQKMTALALLDDFKDEEAGAGVRAGCLRAR